MTSTHLPRALARASLLLAICGSMVCAQNPNLALNQPVTVSGEWPNEPTYGKECLVDGNMYSRWDGYDASLERSDDIWIYVDLGSQRTINHIRIRFEFAFSRVYDIYVSDDAENWTKALSVEWSWCFQNGNAERVGSNVHGIDNLYFEAPVTTRYVKLQNIRRGTPYGVSMWEFEVYGNSETPDPIPTYAAPTASDEIMIDGKWNPVENFIIGQYEYSPFAFHNQTAGIVYDSVVYPGNNRTEWRSKWYITSIMSGCPVDGLTGVKVGPKGYNPATVLPVRVTDDLYTTWDFAVNKTSGTFNATYDIWIYQTEQHASKPGEGTPIAVELMIMPYTSEGYDPHSYSTRKTTATIWGKSWDVFADDHEGGFAWIVYCHPQGQYYYDLEGNLKDFCDHMKQTVRNTAGVGSYVQGKIDEAEWTGWLWAGSEKGRSQAEVVTTAFDVRLTAAVPVSEKQPAHYCPVSSRNARTVLGRMDRTARPGSAYSLRGRYVGTDAELGGAVYIIRNVR